MCCFHCVSRPLPGFSRSCGSFLFFAKRGSTRGIQCPNCQLQLLPGVRKMGVTVQIIAERISGAVEDSCFFNHLDPNPIRFDRLFHSGADMAQLLSLLMHVFAMGHVAGPWQLQLHLDRQALQHLCDRSSDPRSRGKG